MLASPWKRCFGAKIAGRFFLAQEMTTFYMYRAQSDNDYEPLQHFFEEFFLNSLDQKEGEAFLPTESSMVICQ